MENISEELREGIINIYAKALETDNRVDRVALQRKLQQLLKTCVDIDTQSPISINKINRLVWPICENNAESELFIQLENIRYLCYKFPDDPEAFCNEYMTYLVEQTEFGGTELPIETTLKQILEHLSTVVSIRDSGKYDQILTIRDIYSAVRSGILRLERWEPLPPFEELTIAEGYIALKVFNRLSNDRDLPIRLF